MSDKSVAQEALECYQSNVMPPQHILLHFVNKCHHDSREAEEFTLEFLVLSDNLQALEDKSMSLARITILKCISHCERGCKALFKNRFLLKSVVESISLDVDVLSGQLSAMDILNSLCMKCAKSGKRWKRLLALGVLEKWFALHPLVFLLDASTEDFGRAYGYLMEMIVRCFSIFYRGLCTQDPEMIKALTNVCRNNMDTLLLLLPKLIELEPRFAKYAAKSAGFSGVHLEDNYFCFLVGLATHSEELRLVMRRNIPFVTILDAKWTKLNQAIEGQPGPLPKIFVNFFNFFHLLSMDNEQKVQKKFGGTEAKMYFERHLDGELKRIEELSKEEVNNLLRRCGNPDCEAVRGTDLKLKECSGCKQIRYCSKMCQKIHWKTHKKICRKLMKATRKLKCSVSVGT